MSANPAIDVLYTANSVAESFLHLFEGLDYVHPDFALAEALQDQESVYWSFQTYSEKHRSSDPSSSNVQNSYPQIGEGNDHGTNARETNRQLNDHAHISDDEALARALQDSENVVDITNMMTAASIDECNRGHPIEDSDVQIPWQDSIDPDNMTYEELVELGEAVGTHSRGLCSEAIASLPVSKYRACFSFIKKSKHDRCIICQMDYKRGDRLITLPCKHHYHKACISRWLQINKACPVCYVEVFGSSR